MRETGIFLEYFQFLTKKHCNSLILTIEVNTSLFQRDARHTGRGFCRFLFAGGGIVIPFVVLIFLTYQKRCLTSKTKPKAAGLAKVLCQ